MHDGYWALLFCLLANVTTEQAFTYIETGKMPSAGRMLTDKDDRGMVGLREAGMTYQEIGEIHGIAASNAYKRIKRYLKKKGGGLDEH